MGKVYRAVDLHLDRPVAIKLLTDRTLGDPSFIERFKREARLAAQLNHPNIATIYAFGEEQGEAYIAMEFVEGETLSKRLGGGALPIPLVRKFGRQIAAALGVAHAKGIVHRDIKPANLMITLDGDIKVMDFGVARRTGETQLTMAGSIIGTANIMAPEIVRGGEATPAADLFSLGCVLYEMLAGRPAFDGDDAMAVLYLVMHEEPRPVEELRSDTPPDLAAVVAGLLGKDPLSRLGPAGRVAEMLGGITPSAAGETVLLGGQRETLVLPSGGETPLQGSAAETRAPRSARGLRRVPGWAWGIPFALLTGVWALFLREGPPDRPAASAANQRGIEVLEGVNRRGGELGSAGRESLRVAQAHFERATGSDSYYKFAWNNLGDVHRRLGGFAEAERAFRRAVEIDPSYAAAWVNLADLYEKTGRTGAASHAYREALRSNGPALAAIRAASSPPAAAAESLKTNPTLVLAPNNFAFYLARNDQPDSAALVLGPALELFPNFAALWKNYGLALEGQGRHDAADSAFARALTLIPAYPAAEAGRAQVLESRGERDPARALWKSLEGSPDTLVARQAREALARLGP